MTNMRKKGIVLGFGINDMPYGWTKESDLNRRIYNLWHHMIRRCYDKKGKDYKYYGEKGITVCERWKKLSNFVEDIEKINNYQLWVNENNYELDKDINNKTKNKVYCLENCSFELKSKNIAESNKRMSYDFTKTKEHKNKQRKLCKTKRKIMGVSLSDKKVIVLNSLKSSKKFGFNPTCIWRCCNNERYESCKTHKGFAWKYLDVVRGDENE